MQKSFGLFLTLILCAFSYAQEPLSLEKAVGIALHNNTTLLKAENSLKTYESTVLASYGNLLPSVSASGSFDWSKAVTKGGIVSYNGFTIPLPDETRQSRSYNASIRGNWVLFDGLSNLASVSRSKNDREAYAFYLERVKQDVTFQTIDLYYNVLNTLQLVKFREEDVTWNKKNFETVSERNKLGAVTLADVYAQQVRLGNAELELIRARNTHETAKSNLLYYLGLDVLAEYNLTDSLSGDDLMRTEAELKNDMSDLSLLVSKALNKRPDYKSAQLNFASSENDISIAKAGHLPSLIGSAGYSLRGDTPGKISDSKTLYAGLTLSIPIFSGFSVSNRVQAAEVNSENSLRDLEDLERNIKQNIQKNFLDVQAAEKALEVSRRNVEAAEENRRIEQEKYNLGSGTILNVLIANSEYQNAQTNYINVQFGYLTLTQQLKYLVGTLDYKKYE